MTASRPLRYYAAMRVRIVVLVAFAALVACRKSEPQAAQPQRPNWLLDVPYLANSILRDTTGTPDAQHVVLLAPAPLDSVARYYHHRLPLMGWRIVSDVADSIHASQYWVRGSRPMWIQIDAQGPQSLVSYTATGGVADSLTARPEQMH